MLTPEQIEFLEKHLTIPRVFGRKEAKALKAQWAAEFRAFNEHRDAVRLQINAITHNTIRSQLLGQLAGAEPIITRTPKTPDFEGGRKHLEAVGKVVQARKVQTDCTAEVNRVLPLLDQLLATQPDNAATLVLMRDFVTERHAKGLASGDLADFRSALAAVGRLEGEMARAVPAAGAPTSAAVKAVQDELAKADALRAPRAALQAQAERFAKLNSALQTAFAASLPPALALQVAPINTALTVADDAAPTAVQAAADTARGLIDTLDAASKAPLQALKAYEDARAAVLQGPHAALAAHRLVADPVVSPKLVAVNQTLADAQAAATAHDHARALTLVQQAGTQASDAIVLADDMARFLDLRADRVERMAPLLPLNPATLAHVQVQNAVRTAKTQWQGVEDAFASADPARIRAAEPALTAIPAAVKEAQLLLDLAATYDDPNTGHAGLLSAVAAYRGRIRSLPRPLRAGITAHVDGFEALVTAADVATTGDLKVSLSKMATINRSWTGIQARLKELEDFKLTQTGFDARLLEMQGHTAEAGYVAVQDYANRLANDKIHVATLLGQGSYAMAAKIYGASKDGHADQLALLATANAYFTKKATVDNDILSVQALPRGDAPTDSITAAQGQLAAAEAERLAASWTRADELLDQAQERLAAARRIANNAELMDDNTDTAAINAVDVDTDAAFAAYDAVYAVITGADAHKGDLAGKAKEAASLRKQAKTAATAKPPDFAAARVHLNAAAALCQQMLKLWGLKPDFDAQLAEQRSALKVIRKNGWNVDRYFDAEVGQIETLLDGAKADVKPDGFDFAAGQAKITQAMGLVRGIFDTANDYVAARNAKAEIDEWLTDLNATAGVPTHMAAELARLRGLRDACDAALTAKDPKLAKQKGDEAKALLPGYGKDAAECKWYIEAVASDLDPAIASLPATQLYSAAERQQITDLQAAITDNVAARALSAAQRLIFALRDTALQCRAMESKGTAYTAELQLVKPVLTALRARMPAGPGAAAVEAELKALETRLAGAEQAATLRNYGGASERLQGLAAAAAALDLKLAAVEAAIAARTRAEQAMTELDAMSNKSAIEPLVARLKGQLPLAVARADAGDAVAAKAMFDELARGATAARVEAANFASYADLAEDVHQLAATDSDGMDSALRRAQNFIDELKAEPEAMFIFTEMGRAGVALKEARDKAASDPAAAQAALGRAMDQCTAARRAVGLFTQLRASENVARGNIDTLLASHPQAGCVRVELQALLARLDAAMNAVRKDATQRAAAQAEIEAVIAAFQPLRAIADAQIEVAALEQAITAQLPAMEQHTQRYAIAADIAAVRRDLQAGQAEAKAHKMPQALKLLRDARQLQTDALLKAGMHAGAEPDMKALKELMARPGGDKALDALVATLDAKTQRRVMNQVFEARFNCKLALYKQAEFVETEMQKFKTANPDATDEQLQAREQELNILDRSENFDMQPDIKAPDIKRFYDLMCKLPAADTTDNDSLKIFTSKGGPAKGSYYSGHRKEVAMQEGDPNAAGYYGLGQAHELDAVDPDSTPAPGENLSYFSWNTLHEVGHAVDAKLSFMSTRGNAMAGWQEYGSNVLPVAQKIAEHYDFDRDYVAAYMSGNTAPAVPVPKAGVDAQEWERRRSNAVAHVDRIREDKQPWQSAASAKLCDIGGICYQESYPNSWTSYPAALRNKGVSAYQFRAPGEWFSELFAAFHSNKMNPAHPARAWLATL